MFLTYKSFYLKNQLFIRKWFLFLSCVFIFHNIVLTANTMEENHIKSKTTFNYLTLNSGFIYSHFDTFPPGWLQNFFSRIMRKKKTLPSYEIKNNIFPHNEFIKKKSPCQIDFDGFDLHVGESQKRFSYETLFTFSHKEIRNRYPGKDMLHTMVRVIERNNEKIDLTLKFIWNAENPQRFYGNFRNKHPLEIKLMDGDVITLYNRTSGTWVLSEDESSYTMTVNYSIPDHHTKVLEKNFISDVRIYWERGYEDYPVYNIGVLIDQLNCL